MLEKKRDSKAGLAEATPHYHGHRERLRQRFREAGTDALSDYELLELLLFRALPRRCTDQGSGTRDQGSDRHDADIPDR